VSAATLAGIILAILKFAGSLMAFAQEKKLLSEGRKLEIADELSRQISALRRADGIRNRAVDDARRVPADQPLPDDGYRRD